MDKSGEITTAKLSTSILPPIFNFACDIDHFKTDIH